MKIWVVIPAFNEQGTLGVILDELKEKSELILVVDDGSTDNTSSVARQRGVRLIRNEQNYGKGVSLKKGIKYLLDNEEFDYILTMDADRQHAPAEIDKFLEQAKQSQYFVVGNRMANPEGMPMVRILTNKFMSWLISKIMQQRIPDTQCGFRLIKREVLENISIETDNYQIESEILIKAARGGFSIKSIPVKSIYFQGAKSKINPVLDTFRFIRFLFALSDEK